MKPSNERSEAIAIIIFGVTGDLAHRKLLPALYRLVRDKQLTGRFKILGFARRDWSQEQFLEEARNAVQTSSETGTFTESAWTTFARSLEYIQGEFTDSQAYERLSRTLERLTLPNRLYYLATPPSSYVDIAQHLARAELNLEQQGWSRLIIEKPFGQDLKTARELNHILHGVFQESQMYRIDHFLGKETVQNIMALRFANAIFEPVLNRTYVDHVQITVAEDIGIETRGAFYEEAGVLRDMMQNHVMQLLTLMAMEPPVSPLQGNWHPLEAQALRNEKIRVIHSMRPLEASRFERTVVLGQYGTGNVNGQEAIAYHSEQNVAPNSTTPTYAALRVEIDNWRWAGVPFVLRSGKRLKRKTSEIAVVFRRPPLSLFPSRVERNVLVLGLQPDEHVRLRFNAKTPGLETELRRVDMDFSYADFGLGGPTAYERLILDAIEGDASLFPREDEVEAAWAWLDPLLAANLTPTIYPAGSWGPEADQLLGEGRHWRNT